MAVTLRETERGERPSSPSSFTKRPTTSSPAPAGDPIPASSRYERKRSRSRRYDSTVFGEEFFSSFRKWR
jgi:hypothetical protein